MNEPIPDLLAISAEEVLQTMFFTQVVARKPVVNGVMEGVTEKPHLAVRLCFLGGLDSTEGTSTSQPGGHLDLEVSREGAQWIASSFLAAEDGSVPQHRVADVICELTNVVCGNVMSSIASASGFSMLSPEVIRGTSKEWPHTVHYEESFQLERGWLTLRLALADQK
jgi:CheY-specific phosphatase CheX